MEHWRVAPVRWRAALKVRSTFSGPMPSQEPNHIATTPSIRGTSFRSSKSDSLQPPELLTSF
jgi:hypothetical protein